MGCTKTVCLVLLNTGVRQNISLLREVSRVFFGNELSVFNITEQTVLVQAIYMERVSWRSLYASYTLVSIKSVLAKNTSKV